MERTRHHQEAEGEEAEGVHRHDQADDHHQEAEGAAEAEGAEGRMTEEEEELTEEQTRHHHLLHQPQPMH